jgi:hypothetical protein
MSCSGSHRFLIDHGITPTWHVEVDARSHKKQLLGDPHPDVEYLISSVCHPDLIDWLPADQIKLWHIYQGERLDELPLSFPRGEWVFNGGSNVGLRALVLARFMGFKNIEIFGMDCSYPADHSGEHADQHPNAAPKKQRMICEYGGTEYHTTPTLMYYAREFFKESVLLNDCKFVLHGVGLLQHMAYNKYVPPGGTELQQVRVLALTSPQVISDEYLQLNQQLHEQNLYYGVSGHLRADTVLALAQQLGTQDILDYGCGKGTLARALPWPIKEYDPAVPDKKAEPAPADIVICTDVLEHIEPKLLSNVLNDIARCALKLAYLVIHTGPSMKTLSDGRNTHLIQEDRVWWFRELEKYFAVDDCHEQGPELHFLVKRRGQYPGTLSRLDQVTAHGTYIENSGIKFVNTNGMMEYRARTLLTKEPITIEWINTFQEYDVFVDVGANVGVYSLYAAHQRFVKVYSFEPESQNYATLNYNINLNRLGNLVKAYCLALNNKITMSVLNLTEMIAGHSCHQFNRTLDHANQQKQYSFGQGCMGLTLDFLVEQGLIEQPTHIKIDVDGIEHLVIQGATKTLAQTQSLLIEVNQNLPEHQDMVKFLTQQGFEYDPNQVRAAERQEGAFKGVAEHLFRRRC